MKNIIFKSIRPDDLQDLQKLCIKTFTSSYQHKNTKENFEQYIATAFTEKQLLKELENLNSYFYFVFLEQQLVGYLKLNIGDAQTEEHPNDHLEIERIYLLKTFQGKGIGKHMINFSLQRAKALNKSVVWLGVWTENPDAISFYKKQGFRKYAEHVFVFGDEEQTDFLMKRRV